MPRKLISSFGFARRGIIYIWRTQRNMRIHLGVAAFVLVLGYFLRITLAEFLFLLWAVFFVLVTEMLNTAIEEAVDLATLTKRARAMVSKDIAAAAVLAASVHAVIVGGIILGPKLYLFLVGS